MFTRLGCDGRPPRFRVEFYPYSSLVLTIRRREDAVLVRFSDLLRRAPLSVLEGAAVLLLAHVYRRRPPKLLVKPYLEYARSGRTRERMNRMRRGRVRLASSGARGEHFDLHRLFEKLNARYFQGQLGRPHIGWSVPQCAVEYVLYHEMLHVKHPTRRSGCTLVSHSREFREEEKRFPEFERARRILDRLAR
jgi:hypothetical protein